MSDARVLAEAARKEREARKRHSLGKSATILRPEKLSPFERHPTFGFSQLTPMALGVHDDALHAKRAPGAAVRRTEYAEQFDMARISALVHEEQQMLRTCGLDERGHYNPKRPAD